MKILGKVISIVETDVFRHKDGTYGPIYSVRIECGDDEFVARSFHSREGQERIGLRVGAYGEFRITAEVAEGNRKADGKAFMIERKTINRFVALSAQTPQAQNNAPQSQETAQEVETITESAETSQIEQNKAECYFLTDRCCVAE